MARSYWVTLVAALPILSANPAAAIDERVRNACREDYYTFCNAHEVGSEALRECMRKADKKLSPSCIDALVAAGEVSGKEVARRRATAR
jgi:hypothetical protein